jgi:hypothetical protein
VANFRKGEREEWRTALTPDQQQRATMMLPETMLRRFGWAAS